VTLALCYLKPDVLITGCLARAFDTMHLWGYRVRRFQIVHMSDRLYHLAYERGFDAKNDSWLVNRRCARLGPWLALMVSSESQAGNIQACLKSHQGAAIPAGDGLLRERMGHMNRLLNCLHVPDTAIDAAEQADILFPCRCAEPANADVRFLQVYRELSRHNYGASRQTRAQFQATLAWRVIHRACRVSRNDFYDADFNKPATVVARAIDVLDASSSEAAMMKSLLCDGVVVNSVMRAMNVEQILSRNFIHLTEWDRAMLFGYFAYPPVASQGDCCEQRI
jgi:hypothetical protein